MRHALNPFRFVVTAVAGWMNQQQAIDYLLEENRVLREQLGGGDYGLAMISVAVWQPRSSWWGVEYWMTLPKSLPRTHCWPGTAD